MSGDVLLDTNIAIAFLESEPAVLSKAAGRHICISTVVLGELYFGAYKSRLVNQNVSRVESFASGILVIGVDSDTAKQFGQIKHQLRLKGRPIPENDAWIAATAKRYALTLVSRDSHFKDVDQIALEVW